MALRIPHELARLIRDRAYQSGALAEAERRVAALRPALQDAEHQRDTALSALVEIDAKLAKYPTIQLEAIRPIEEHPRRLELTHVAFTKEVVRFLRKAGGPISTMELQTHLFQVFSLQRGQTPEEREWQRHKLTKQLRAMVKRERSCESMMQKTTR